MKFSISREIESNRAVFGVCAQEDSGTETHCLKIDFSSESSSEMLFRRAW